MTSAGVGLSQLLGLIQLGLIIWALIHVAQTRPDAFPAVDKQTKQFWLLVLGGTLVITGFLGILRIMGLIVALIYLLDVRPAINEILRGR